MFRIDFFVTEINGNEVVAGTKEWLGQQEQEIEFEDGVRKVTLDQEGAAEKFFGGKWHWIEIKTPWKGEDSQRVEKQIRSYDQNTRSYVRDDTRYFGALAEKAVTGWSFTTPITEAGFYSLCDDVQEHLGYLIKQQCYPTIRDHKAFKTPSMSV